MDRRVARTLARIREAHLSLIVEKGYDAVTVEDICQRADVGRSTFYAHFTSKEDLHRRGLESLRRELEDAQASARAENGPESSFTFSRPMFEHARAHLDLYRALTGSRGGALAMEAVRAILADVVRRELPRLGDRAGPSDIPRELAVQFFVGAYVEMLTRWLEEGAKVSPESMDRAFQRLAREGLGVLRAATCEGSGAPCARAGRSPRAGS